jgi:glycosyltransferase 2 family protein
MHSISPGASLPVEVPVRRADRLTGRRRRIVALVAGSSVSALLLFLTVRKLDLSSVVTALREADMRRVALGVVVMACVYVVQALRWRWIARGEGRLSTWRFLQYVVGGVALNNAVPGRPGDLLRAHWLGLGAGIPRAKALGTVVVDRSADLLILVALLALTLPVVGLRAAWLESLAIAAFVVTSALLLALLVAYRFRRSLGARLGSRLGRLRQEASKLIQTMTRTCNPVGVAGIVVASCAAWSLWATSAWLLAGSVGIDLSFLQLALLTAVVNLGVAIPSSPGFVGTYQWLCVSALAVFAVPRSDAFAFSVISHAAWFIPTSLAGVALLAAKALVRLQESPAGSSARETASYEWRGLARLSRDHSQTKLS